MPKMRNLKPWTAAALLVAAVASQVCTGAAPESSANAERAVYEMLVKNALAALNHANITGNYTVLRDLGTEDFRRRNSAADLATAFAAHRQKHYDLSPILCVAPQFTPESGEVAPGRLQFVGSFPTQPEAVHFTVVYARGAAGWALDEVTVGMASTGNASEPGT